MDVRPKGPPKRYVVVQTPAPNSEIDVLWVLGAFRLLNALTIATFFQPDEYFQALEPAWQMAFGSDSGAWITWVSVSIALSGLTYSIIGVEVPSPVLCYPRIVCRHLLPLEPDLHQGKCRPVHIRRPFGRRAKGITSAICSIDGSLHMEVCGESIWTTQ